jgi:Transglycosylase SLT domain
LTERSRTTGGFDLFTTGLSTSPTSPAPSERVGSVKVEPVTAAPPTELPKTATRNSVAPIDPKEGQALLNRSKEYDEMIRAAAIANNVDPDLLIAIIDKESSFNPKAKGPTNDYGLGQVTVDSARGIDPNVTVQDLLNPAKNVQFAAKLLAQRYKRFTDPTTNVLDLEAVIAAYNGNGGSGRNGRFANDGYYCLKNRLKVGNTTFCDGVPLPKEPNKAVGEWVWTPAGEFGNRRYINSVLSRYNYLRQNKGKAPVSTQVGLPQTPVPLGSGGTINPANPQAQVQIAQQQRLSAIVDDYRTRFGDNILPLIEPNPSAMRNKISRDGYDNYLSKNNSFVAPFPTTTKVELKIQGIGGISIGDGFYVQKLPYIFEKYGCFMVTQLAESITSNGWISKITGYFKVIWLNGEGQ